MRLIEKNIDQIIQLCKELNVKSFSTFGSVLKDELTTESDIDFAVDFNENDPLKYSDLYFNLKERLEKMFNRPIDLIERRAIRNNAFANELRSSQRFLYGS